MLPSENVKASLLSFIVSGIVSVVIAPIVTLITVNVTHIIQRERIEVISLLPSATAEPVKISKETSRLLVSAQKYQRQCSGNRFYLSGKRECHLSGTEILFTCLESAINRIDSVLEILNEETVILAGPSADWQPLSCNYGYIAGGQQFPVPFEPEEYIRRYRRFSEDAASAKSEIRSLLSSTPIRTGDIFFDLTILNRGMSDSLIYHKGTVRFAGHTLQIGGEAGKTGEVVRAGNVLNITLRVDRDNSPGTALQDWERLVRNRIPQEFLLSVDYLNGTLNISGRLPLGEVHQDREADFIEHVIFADSDEDR